MKVKVSGILTLIFIFSLISSMLMLILNPLRLLFIFDTFSVFIAVNFFLLACSFFLGIVFYRYIRVELIEVSMIILLLALLVKSILVAHDYKLGNVFLDFFKPTFFIVTVCVFRNLFNIKALFSNSFIKRVPKVVMLVTMLMIVISIAINEFYMPIYPAYTIVESTLAFNAFNPIKNIIFSIWLFFGGKRGVFLAFFCMVIIYLILVSNPRKIVIAFFLLLFLMVPLSISFFEYIITIFFKVISISELETMNLEELFVLLGGGRVSEITSSLSYIDSIQKLIFGCGLGFEYIVQNFGDKSGMLHRNVHFSPVSIVTIYGALFAILFYIYIIKYFIMAFKVILINSHTNIIYSVSFFFMCSVFFSFTEYVFFSYSNIPIAMGIIGTLCKFRNSKGERVCVG
ncbi:hypothetical protein [Vibrio cholerae]|uniref:hypothetical protein n=1 Tax=Vibrio cholerae TaxID=666 RepID=UPI002067CEFC|nr:hypothetical protein [Vibrio cholerae]MCU4227901.1 hypothetical protein [Vibrio cholerae]BCN20401.1 putative O-antigen polymerase [Vibrio cholerae]GIA64077.1 hypothetical protein VCSRO4_1983 [Vibrio cholerae]